jgi:hypothetical protein
MKNKPLDHLSTAATKLFESLKEEYAIHDCGGLEILKTGLEARDRFTGIRVRIDAEGLTVTDRFGTEKPHPLLAAERDARGQWLSALKMLNLDIEPLRDGPGRPPGS